MHPGSHAPPGANPIKPSPRVSRRRAKSLSSIASANNDRSSHVRRPSLPINPVPHPIRWRRPATDRVRPANPWGNFAQEMQMAHPECSECARGKRCIIHLPMSFMKILANRETPNTGPSDCRAAHNFLINLGPCDCCPLVKFTLEDWFRLPIWFCEPTNLCADCIWTKERAGGFDRRVPTNWRQCLDLFRRRRVQDRSATIECWPNFQATDLAALTALAYRRPDKDRPSQMQRWRDFYDNRFLPQLNSVPKAYCDANAHPSDQQSDCSDSDSWESSSDDGEDMDTEMDIDADSTVTKDIDTIMGEAETSVTHTPGSRTTDGSNLDWAGFDNETAVLLRDAMAHLNPLLFLGLFPVEAFAIEILPNYQKFCGCTCCTPVDGQFSMCFERDPCSAGEHRAARLLGTLIHEMVHAYLSFYGTQYVVETITEVGRNGHGPAWQTLMIQIDRVHRSFLGTHVKPNIEYDVKHDIAEMEIHPTARQILDVFGQQHLHMCSSHRTLLETLCCNEDPESQPLCRMEHSRSQRRKRKRT